MEGPKAKAALVSGFVALTKEGRAYVGSWSECVIYHGGEALTSGF